MRSTTWLTGWFISVILLLGTVTGFIYYVDPFFHYHKPHTEQFFYRLDNQRCQNDGILRHFDYDALITGTSMVENFKTSDLDSFFSVRSVKVPYSGAAFKEVSNGIDTALKSGNDIKMVVRSIDIGYLFLDKDWLREDLGEYPDYLYDNNPFNDVEYIFNKDVIFDRSYGMVLEREQDDFVPGLTSFDDYSYWQNDAVMGRDAVCPYGLNIVKDAKPIHITDEEKACIKANFEQNFIEQAIKNPDVEFYVFFTPYSMAWWCDQVSSGNVYKIVEAEQYIMELLVQYDNIRVYSFNDRIDIIGNLDNYKDSTHYGAWVCRDILKCMREDTGRISGINYMEFTNEELKRYLEYDYQTLLQ